MKQSHTHKKEIISKATKLSLKTASFNRGKFGKNNKKMSSRQPTDTYRAKYIRKIQRQMNKSQKMLDKRTLQIKFRKFLETKQEEFATVSMSSLSCPICLDMLMSPSTTNCGHNFCFRCIQETLMRQATCPVCRTIARTQELAESISFQKITELVWKNSGKSEEYVVKYEENKKWLSTRKIDESMIKAEQQIDIRDTQFIWCKARILQLFKDDNTGNLKFIKVHYMGWNKLYDEIIDIGSQRLAPLNFFTYRVDIPHYEQTNPDEQNMRSRINYGTTTRQLFDPQRRQRPQRNFMDENHLLFLRRPNENEGLRNTIFDLTFVNEMRPRGNNRVEIHPYRIRNANDREPIREQILIADSSNQSASEPPRFQIEIQDDHSQSEEDLNNPQAQRRNRIQMNNEQVQSGDNTIRIQLNGLLQQPQEQGQINQLGVLDPHFGGGEPRMHQALNYNPSSEENHIQEQDPAQNQDQ